jgi:flagellin
MSSLFTNVSAMTALANLRMVNANLATTQARISTGQRVASASDNAAYWSIATTMRADNSALSAVSDSLGLSGAMVDTAYTAMNSILGSDGKSGLGKLEALLVESKTAGIDRAKIQAEITQIQADMKTNAAAATANGVNLVSFAGAPTLFNLVASFSETAGTPTIGVIPVDAAKTALYNGGNGILDKTVAGNVVDTLNVGALTDSAPDQAAITTMITTVATAINLVTVAASTLGAVKSRLENSGNFIKALQDSVTRGIGQLVDADMSAESTRLQALQVQQQLGVQSLSIANQSGQTLLQLFNNR